MKKKKIYLKSIIPAYTIYSLYLKYITYVIYGVYLQKHRDIYTQK